MPVIPSAVLQRIATLPIAIHEADEIVFAAGTTTGRLLILMKGAVTSEKEGTEIAKVTEPGAVFGELSALLNQPHTAACERAKPRSFASRAPSSSKKILSYFCTLRQSWHSVSTMRIKLSLN